MKIPNTNTLVFWILIILLGMIGFPFVPVIIIGMLIWAIWKITVEKSWEMVGIAFAAIGGWLLIIAFYAAVVIGLIYLLFFSETMGLLYNKHSSSTSVPVPVSQLKTPVTQSYQEWLKENNMTALEEQELCKQSTGHGMCGAYNCISCER